MGRLSIFYVCVTGRSTHFDWLPLMCMGMR